MKRNNELRIRLRAAGFGLLGAAAVLFAGCEGEEFVRDGGEMPLPAGDTPTGALYAEGGYDPELQDFAICQDEVVSVVYRLNYPATEDVTVTLSVGTQEDVDAYNDAKGLRDVIENLGGCKRYRLLPETNYELPEAMTLTVPKGKTESEPLFIAVIYDKALLQDMLQLRMNYPWMLPLQVESIQGNILPLIADQQFGIGIRPGNLPSSSNGEMKLATEKPRPFTSFVFVDCRVVNPSYVIYYGYKESLYEAKQIGSKIRYVENRETITCYPMFDVECLRPLFIAQDAVTQGAVLQTDPDLMYVLTHQERYVDPQRKLDMKVCVSIETQAKSPVGLCNLSEENRSSLAWQIANFVKKYGLDGVALNDKGANYAVERAPAVDKSSYTKFLKALREALGNDKLILLSYDFDENSALYEAHDGLQAGDYLDFAWWGTENELCTPYDPESPVTPIAGLDKSKFAPIAGNPVDTPEFKDFWDTQSNQNTQKLKDLYDTGDCPGAVCLGILARTQNFAESYQQEIPSAIGPIPLHETDRKTKPGWYGQAFFAMEISIPEWTGGAYGAGLKDW
ncbi:MAG TPA: DUF1735 domain-containing protein [Candidatus Alistipes intestinigallinarum]|uniref:DUF1735 domain-containing protein n=1 Tax=Candidatus Alistipes intestinigallinarum TaxID=2838440 RepID=A0A9D2CBY4_9BACT|nr:DUF1735 domain-containing protein [Candidatus Alistipes intestinigallinarum]